MEETKELSLDDTDDHRNNNDNGEDSEDEDEDEEDDAALEDEVAVLGICDGGRSAARVTKASRYLGDQGTCVEFALNFAAYPHLDSSHPPPPRGSLAAAMAAHTDYISSSSSKKELTTVYFRGFIDTGLPKVMEGYTYMPANETLAARARKAASANSHYEQVTRNDNYFEEYSRCTCT